MEVLTTVDDARLHTLLADDTFFWLDLLEPDRDEIDALSGLLGLHPAAVEDTREWDQLPRLDDYGDHVLLIFFTARDVEGSAEPVEVHVYVSGRWIVTARRCETPLDSKREWLAQAEYDDEDEILYQVLDALADGWDPVIDTLEQRVDALEDLIFTRATQAHLETIYRLKQQVGGLLRRAHPLAGIFPAAIDTIHDLEGLSHGSREWLRDVDAHLDSIHSDLRQAAAELTALTDTFFNANANRLNQLATRIAVGSMFFLIWTLVTGFFGQNFKYLTDHIDTKGAFLAYEIGALLLPTVVLVVVLYRKRKDWL